MARAIRDLAISAIFALIVGVLLARQLKVDLPKSFKILSGAATERDTEEKFARIGRAPDLNYMYNYLVKLDSEQLYKLRATENICQGPGFDCRGVSKASVLSLIDGVLRHNDEDNSARSSRVSFMSLIVSAFSAFLSLLTSFRKK